MRTANPASAPCVPGAISCRTRAARLGCWRGAQLVLVIGASALSSSSMAAMSASIVSSIRLICVPLSYSLERPNFQRLSVTSSWVSLSILAWRCRISLSLVAMTQACCWLCRAILAINSETNSRSCSAFKLGRDSRATTMHSSVPWGTISCYWRMP